VKWKKCDIWRYQTGKTKLTRIQLLAIICAVTTEASHRVSGTRTQFWPPNFLTCNSRAPFLSRDKVPVSQLHPVSCMSLKLSLLTFYNLSTNYRVGHKSLDTSILRFKCIFVKRLMAQPVYRTNSINDYCVNMRRSRRAYSSTTSLTTRWLASCSCVTTHFMWSVLTCSGVQSTAESRKLRKKNLLLTFKSVNRANAAGTVNNDDLVLMLRFTSYFTGWS
jgi:hypothetical protein